MKKTGNIIFIILIMAGAIAGSGFVSPAQLNKFLPPWLSWSIIIFGGIVIVFGLCLGLINLDKDNKPIDKKN